MQTHNSYYLMQQMMGFTSNDLAANRAGQMSERQCHALQVQRQRRMVEFSLALGGVLIFFMLMSLSILTAGEGGVLLAVLFLASVFGRAAARNSIWRFWRGVGSDLQTARASMVYGRVYVDISRLRAVQIYHLHVAARGRARSFEIDEETSKLFEVGQPYRIYFAPQSGVILSAEAL